MQLLEEVVAIMTPLELHNLRKKFGVTLRALSQRTGVSTAQLCEFEHGDNGLRVAQIKACRDALVEIARERSQVLAKLLASEEEMVKEEYHEQLT